MEAGAGVKPRSPEWGAREQRGLDARPTGSNTLSCRATSGLTVQGRIRKRHLTATTVSTAIQGHFETNRLTERRGRFTSKCGLARNDTGAACQKLTYAPQQGVSFSQWAPETQPPLLCPVGKMPAKEPAVKGEGLGPQGGRVALQCVCGQAAAVHRMDPSRPKPLNATYNAQNGVSAAE